MNHQTHIIAEGDDDIRLDRWFKRNLPDIPHGLVQKSLRKGMIKLNGKKAETSTHVIIGQEIRIHNAVLQQGAIKAGERAKNLPYKPPPQPLTKAQIANTKKMVIHTTKDAFLLNKPAGLAVQGGSGITDSIDHRLASLKQEGEPRPKLTHRLDKDTSGVLLIARNAKSAERYTKAFANKIIKKSYHALIMGVPEIREGTIDLKIDKQGGKGSERMVIANSGKRAISHYRVIDTVGEHFSWIELVPETGRTHQLRVHMTEIGHPIVGDGKYGGRDAFPTGMDLPNKLHLHARRLVMPNEFDITAPHPPHILKSFQLLGIELDREGESIINEY